MDILCLGDESAERLRDLIESALEIPYIAVVSHSLNDALRKAALRTIHTAVLSYAGEAPQAIVDQIDLLRTARPGLAIVVCAADGAERLLAAGAHEVIDHAAISAAALGRAIEAARARAAYDRLERTRADDTLRAVEDRYRRTFEHALTGDCVIAPDDRIVDCNTTFARMFGFAAVGDAIGTPIRRILGPEDCERLFEDLRASPTLERYEIELRTLDGVPLRVIGNFIATFDDAGTRLLVQASLFDITELKRLEQVVHETRKYEAVGRLAGGIAHDFNNLLTIIIGQSDRLTDDFRLQAGAASAVSAIRRAAERAASLTRQLLAYSRRQILEPKTVDVNGWLARARTLLEGMVGARVQVTLALDPRAPVVRVDPVQLEQVIVNLVVNAADAMPDGGRLTIRTAPHVVHADSEPDLAWLVPGEYLRLDVIDTGIGMDAEIQAHLFEPFFTTKGLGKGSGLGLATLYGIVKQSRGFIWAQSAPGEGTTFTVLLPAVAGDSQRAAAASETVLVVEDDDGLRHLLVQMLESRGFTVLDAPSGERAAQVRALYPGRIDLLLADVKMSPTTGPEVAALFRRDDASLRVLYMSGVAADDTGIDLTLGPGDGYIQKPFSPPELLQQIHALLARRR